MILVWRIIAGRVILEKVVVQRVKCYHRIRIRIKF